MGESTRMRLTAGDQPADVLDPSDASPAPERALMRVLTRAARATLAAVLLTGFGASLGFAWAANRERAELLADLERQRLELRDARNALARARSAQGRAEAFDDLLEQTAAIKKAGLAVGMGPVGVR